MTILTADTVKEFITMTVGDPQCRGTMKKRDWKGLRSCDVLKAPEYPIEM